MTLFTPQQLIDFAYLVAAALFILALRWLSSPSTARRGVLSGEIGAVIAVVATLCHFEIIQYQWIVVALVVGAMVGVPLGLVPMTAVPQRTAVSHACGALAAALIGIAEYYVRIPHLTKFMMTEIALEVITGSLTFTGSLIAAGKLQEILPQRPITYKGQNLVSLSVLGAAILMALWLVFHPASTHLFSVMVVVSLIFGALLVTPIGGADMPTVISLLNSYAGLSAALLGFVLNSKVLVVAGALDGSSGFILSVIMCKAMNRSFTNVMFGAFGQVQASAVAGKEERTARSATAEEAAAILGAANAVVIVPGYGMAVAQAQHKVRELYDSLTKRGVEVKFGIHPVAGRMPGHMNVLLAEADIPYDKLMDMDTVNPEMPQMDVALIIGANDVTNPAARTDPGSPIYGMPILNVDKARTVMVIKRSMSPGFAGIDNELYYLDKTLMLFGDAKTFVGNIVRELGAGGQG
ncbi:MAG TPA: NAD(P)(+) transhydrogenase (Re/Si-specific) subunit beta [Terriglobia bacterium]|nr:NAD(P)(+) transhydrogenase (Re/Si-specific) subunit beta [Terriglobia bacterium]HVB29240.1 NAD(P)(+) transhydrogenase (Re/Si-specific) subunit beta [Terriglobia bacterium]